MALVKVEFEWDDKHGECYDCGRPAAYQSCSVKERYCAVCVIDLAMEGEQFTYLFEGEE